MVQSMIVDARHWTRSTYNPPRSSLGGELGPSHGLDIGRPRSEYQWDGGKGSRWLLTISRDEEPGCIRNKSALSLCEGNSSASSDGIGSWPGTSTPHPYTLLMESYSLETVERKSPRWQRVTQPNRSKN